MNKNISLVIPTYRGGKNIELCLQSILNQTDLNLRETIVIVDGKDEYTERIIQDYKVKFQVRKQKLITKVFEVNQGRFQARFEGARLAKSDTLLFLDDRTYLATSYLQQLRELLKKEDVIISNVIEASQPTIASKALYYVRKTIYPSWGTNFSDYYITETNFGKSAKGTAGLIVPRELFIDACGDVMRSTNITDNVSDDTRLLQIILSVKQKILRTAKLTIYYRPRSELLGELIHIYERGPKFIDYYLHPRTRFFVPLIGFYIFIVLVVVGIFTVPVVVAECLILAVGALWISSIVMSRNIKESLLVGAGLVVMLCCFGLGLIYGTYLKMVGQHARR